MNWRRSLFPVISSALRPTRSTCTARRTPLLAGMDRLTRDHRNVLLIGTTNFPKASTGQVHLPR